MVDERLYRLSVKKMSRFTATPVTVRELSALVGMTKEDATKIVATMKREGLVVELFDRGAGSRVPSAYVEPARGLHQQVSARRAVLDRLVAEGRQAARNCLAAQGECAVKKVKREHLVEKLHPSQFSGASGLWRAIVGCIIGERVTQPAITQLVVTSDDCVLASHTNGPLCNAFIGALSDLRSNWRRYCDAAGLNDDERAEADRWFRTAVGRASSSDRRPENRDTASEP